MFSEGNTQQTVCTLGSMALTRSVAVWTDFLLLACGDLT